MMYYCHECHRPYFVEHDSDICPDCKGILSPEDAYPEEP